MILVEEWTAQDLWAFVFGTFLLYHFHLVAK